MKCSFIVAGILCMTLTACTSKHSADLLVYNGSIHLFDTKNSVAEAMVIADGIVTATGTYASLLNSYDCARTLDLNGKHVFPGFTDAHAHLYGLGEQHVIIDLKGSTAPEECIARIQNQKEKRHGGWIRGRGWDQNEWKQPTFPGKALLDEAFPDIPVFLVRIDGHAAWVNSKALALASINAHTPDPAGGKILRTNGEPNGILLDNAIELVRSNIPSPTIEEYKTAYENAIHDCLCYGITGIHDMGLNADQIRALKELIAEERCPFRITGYVDGTGPAWEDLLREEKRIYGNHQLALAGLKMYADGALGSRGALLLAPYSDDPGNQGVAITSTQEIETQCIRALREELQVCVHAIGDSAVRAVLNGYEAAIRKTGSTGHRLRIEHSQVISPEDIPRYAKLQIIPSFQPIHCTSDMYWAEARLGPERIHGAYAWNTMRQQGCILPFGSDFPVEHQNPLAGIYAACTRQNAQGIPATEEDITQYFVPLRSEIRLEQYTNGWYAQEIVPRMDALRGFTTSAAYAGKQEQLFGSLTIDHYADFIITENDLTQCPAQQLRNSLIVATYVEGNLVYSSLSEGRHPDVHTP